MTYKQKLLATQVYIHLVFVLGLFIFPWYVTLPTIILSQIFYVGFCGTMLFHRTVAHKNDINPLAEKFFIIFSWLGATSSAIAWAGVHRKHHRFSDTDKDPHSPKVLGRFKAYWQLSENDKDIVKYVPDLLRKPLYVFQHKYYFEILWSIHLIAFLIFSVQYYWMLVIVPGFLMWFMGSMINVFCHGKNGPKNVNLLGFLVGGEGWHSNHHEQPANPSFRHWADWGGHFHKVLRLK